MKRVPLTPLTPAQRQWVEDVTPIAMWVVYTKRRSLTMMLLKTGRHTMDDIKQAAITGLIRHATKYDPDTSKPSTFVHMVVSHTLIKLANYETFACRDSHRHTISIDCTRVNTGNGCEYTSDYFHPEADDVEAGDATASNEARDAMRDALRFLDPRWRQVLTMRFGLDGNGVHTLDEVGKIIGVTRERVRQIETKAMDKLRLRAPELAKFAREEATT